MSGWIDSTVSSAAYTITGTVATPTFSVAGGTYTTAQTVAISSTTAGSSIRYTTDGSTPSSTVGTLYSGPIPVSSSMTVKAIGYMSGWTNSAVSSVAYTITGTVATPTFSVAGGTYTTAQTVAISSTTPGSSIRYTIDGSTPSSTVGTLYTSPIPVSSSMTVKAVGYNSGWTNSTVSSAAYTITGTVAVPTFSPTGGTYTAPQTVTITTSTTGSSIRYTTDGTTPSATVGTLYSAPIPVSSSKTVKAIGYKSGWTNSAVSSAVYTITGTVASPTFSPAGGTYTTAQSVTLSSTTSGSSIRYTTDGSTPSSTVGTLYSGPIPVSSSKTVKAIGYKSGWINSAVSSTSYTINQSTLQPPSNPFPTNGATAVATSLTLQCNAVTGATQYQFYLGTSSTTLSLIATTTATGNVVRQAVSHLSAGTTYFWKVIAINGGSSASGPVWSFKTN
jgi:biotin transporter BioY